LLQFIKDHDDSGESIVEYCDNGDAYIYNTGSIQFQVNQW